MAKQKDIPTYICEYPEWGGFKRNYAVKKYRGRNPRHSENNIYTCLWERISPIGAKYCVGMIILPFSAN